MKRKRKTYLSWSIDNTNIIESKDFHCDCPFEISYMRALLVMSDID